MTDERMTPAEVEAVLARIEGDLSDLQERVMGHQPLTNAKDLVDAAHKRLNETQVRVADLEEWKARTEGGLPPVEPGATFTPTGPAFTLTHDGRMVRDLTVITPDERESEIDGQMVWTWYRDRVGGVSWDGKDLPEDVRELGHDRMMGWEHVAKMAGGEKHGDATVEELNTLLGRSYDRNREQRKLIERQRDEIAVLVRERDNARAECVQARTARARELDNKDLALRQTESALTDAEDERDEARTRLAEAKAQRDQALDAEKAERTMKEAAWADAKQLRERMMKIANISDEPPF